MENDRAYLKKDLSYKESLKKNRLYSKYNNLHFTTPSYWLYDCAKKSKLTSEKPIFYIPNILDKLVFKNFNKEIARNIINVPQHETIIAFGAVSISSPYKGWGYLIKALKIFNENNHLEITALIFGSEYNREIEESIPFPIKFMGFLKDELPLSLVYNAADIFVAPSVAETLGYVIMESLRCGTPVVGFNTGGISDLIIHKKNGYLAEYRNSKDLALGIEYCIKNQIKGFLDKKFDEEIVIAKHCELIDNLIKKS